MNTRKHWLRRVSRKVVTYERMHSWDALLTVRARADGKFDCIKESLLGPEEVVLVANTPAEGRAVLDALVALEG